MVVMGPRRSGDGGAGRAPWLVAASDQGRRRNAHRVVGRSGSRAVGDRAHHRLGRARSRWGCSAGGCWSPRATRWPPVAPGVCGGRSPAGRRSGVVGGDHPARRRWHARRRRRGAVRSCRRCSGLALSVAMGALAFEHDVIGSDFGLPQVLSGVAAVATRCSRWCPSASRRSTGGGTSPRAVSGGYSNWSTTATDFAHGVDRRSRRAARSPVGRSMPWQGCRSGTSIGVDPLITQRYRLDGGDGIATLSGPRSMRR